MRAFIYRTRPTMAQSLAADTVDVNRLGTTHSALEPEANAERLDAYKALAVQSGEDYAARHMRGAEIVARLKAGEGMHNVLREVCARAERVLPPKPAYPGPVLTLQDIRRGSGFPRNARFILVESHA